MPNRRYFDVAIGEAEGNGGDIKLLGNDLAVIYSHENQVYLALFGGNVEQSTPAQETTKTTEDWWGNNLLFGGDAAKQFNSETERALNNTALNSAGRSRIENAVRSDLQYLRQLGVTISIDVEIIAVNTVKILIRTEYPGGPNILSVVTFGRRFTDGDFSLLDFSSDFY